MTDGREVVLAHGGTDSTSTLLIMAALGVTAALPVVAVVLFVLASARRRHQDRQQKQPERSPQRGPAETEEM